MDDEAAKALGRGHLGIDKSVSERVLRFQIQLGGRVATLILPGSTTPLLALKTQDGDDRNAKPEGQNERRYSGQQYLFSSVLFTFLFDKRNKSVRASVIKYCSED